MTQSLFKSLAALLWYFVSFQNPLFWIVLISKDAVFVGSICTSLTIFLLYFSAWAFLSGARQSDMLSPSDASAFQNIVLVCIGVGFVTAIGYQAITKIPSQIELQRCDKFSWKPQNLTCLDYQIRFSGTTGWVLKNGPPKMWLYINFEAFIPKGLRTIITSDKYRNDDKK